MKICDSHRLVVNTRENTVDQTLTTEPAPVAAVTPSAPVPLPPVSPAAEYNLKRALASGQVKRLAAAAPEKQLDLPKAPLQIETKNEAGAAAKIGAKVESKIEPKTESKAEPKTEPPVGLKTKSPVPASPLFSPLGATPASSLNPLIASAPAALIKKSATVLRPTPKNGFWSNFNLFKSKPPARKLPAAPAVAAASQPVRSRPAPTPSVTRPVLHDVKPVPKIVGPIEELQFLDLANFRRLGQTPTETADKILAKIKLLEKDGYDKMVAGVLAWRQSPVNRLYLRLGREALNQGVLLKDYLASRRSAGQEYLSWEEVEALVNLNGKLSF